MTDLSADVTVATPPDRGRTVRAREALSFRNISALYIFAALFVLFALWVPDTFLTNQVWRSLLD